MVTGKYSSCFSIEGPHNAEEFSVVIQASISLYDSFGSLLSKTVSKLNSKPIVISSLRTSAKDDIDLSQDLFGKQVDEYFNNQESCQSLDESVSAQQEQHVDSEKQCATETYGFMSVQTLRLDYFSVHIPFIDSEITRAFSLLKNSNLDANEKLSSDNSYSQVGRPFVSNDTQYTNELTSFADKRTVFDSVKSVERATSEVYVNSLNCNSTDKEDNTSPVVGLHTVTCKRESVEILPYRDVTSVTGTSRYGLSSETDSTKKFSDVFNQDNNVAPDTLSIDANEIKSVQLKCESGEEDNRDEIPKLETDIHRCIQSETLNTGGIFNNMLPKATAIEHKRKVGRPRKKARKATTKSKQDVARRHWSLTNNCSEGIILNEDRQTKVVESKNQNQHVSGKRKMSIERGETDKRGKDSDNMITQLDASNITDSDNIKGRKKRRCSMNVYYSYKALINELESQVLEKNISVPTNGSDPEFSRVDKASDDPDYKPPSDSDVSEAGSVSCVSSLDDDTEEKPLKPSDMKKTKQMRKTAKYNMKKITKKNKADMKRGKRSTTKVRNNTKQTKQRQKQELFNIKRKKLIRKEGPINVKTNKRTTTKQKTTTGKHKVSVNLCDHEDKYEIVKFISSEQQNRGKPIAEISYDSYSCKICKSFQVIDKASMRLHIGQHIQGFLRCKVCDTEFSSQNRRNFHMRQYHYSEFADKGTMCEQCGQLFDETKHRCRHMFKVHKIPAFECRLCVKQGKHEREKFAMPADVYRHEREKHFEELFICSKCDKHCVKAFDLVRHQIFCPKNNNGQEHSLFHCKECSFSTSRKEYLTIHVSRVHRKEKNCKCELCDYKAYAQSNINRHIAHVHQGNVNVTTKVFITLVRSMWGLPETPFSRKVLF